MVVFRHRGREISEGEIAALRRLIAEHPGASRRALSQHVCAAWNWVQPNGEPRDMVCRGLMLALHRAGLLELPPVRCRQLNNVVARRSPPAVGVDQTSSKATRPNVKMDRQDFVFMVTSSRDKPFRCCPCGSFVRWTIGCARSSCH